MVSSEFGVPRQIKDLDERKRIADLSRGLIVAVVIGARVPSSDDRLVIACEPAKSPGKPVHPVIEPNTWRPIVEITRGQSSVVVSRITSGGAQDALTEHLKTAEHVTRRLIAQAHREG